MQLYIKGKCRYYMSTSRPVDESKGNIRTGTMKEGGFSKRPSKIAPREKAVRWNQELKSFRTEVHRHSQGPPPHQHTEIVKWGVWECSSFHRARVGILEDSGGRRIHQTDRRHRRRRGEPSSPCQRESAPSGEARSHHLGNEDKQVR
jgi:hypothetical protein